VKQSLSQLTFGSAGSVSYFRCMDRLTSASYENGLRRRTYRDAVLLEVRS